MRESFNDHHSPISLADVMLKVLLMVFLSMTVLALIAKKNAEEGNVKKKAEYQITAEWNKTRSDDVDCDVDLWVKNPNGQIVFWRVKDNSMMNIERDDIGKRNDYITLGTGEVVENPEDMEYWYLRGLIPGEFTVNLHLYACRVGNEFVSAGTPIPPVDVEVKLVKLNPKMKIMYVESVTLTELWQQETVMNFTLAASGELEKVTHIPINLFSSEVQPTGVQ